jgi:hypothetical protein
VKVESKALAMGKVAVQHKTVSPSRHKRILNHPPLQSCANQAVLEGSSTEVLQEIYYPVKASTVNPLSYKVTYLEEGILN